MLETWLQGMSDTLNESLEHVKVIFRQKRWDLEQKKIDFFDFSILAQKGPPFGSKSEKIVHAKILEI